MRWLSFHKQVSNLLVVDFQHAEEHLKMNGNGKSFRANTIWLFEIERSYALSVQMRKDLIHNTQDDTILLNHQHTGTFFFGIMFFFLSIETNQEGENVPPYIVISYKCRLWGSSVKIYIQKIKCQNFAQTGTINIYLQLHFKYKSGYWQYKFRIAGRLVQLCTSTPFELYRSCMFLALQ